MYYRYNNLLLSLLLSLLSLTISLNMLSKLSLILGDIESFISNIKKKVPDSIQLNNYELDHICYRCSTKESYKSILKQLEEYGDSLVEGMIGIYK